MAVEAQRYIVLGGGVAGLATARELVRRGYDVVVLEKGAQAGGLARTLVYDGFRFDIGGHRFHSNNPDVVNWVKELLGDDLLTVPRYSHIRMNGRYIDYPLQFPNALSSFPPLTAVKVVLSYLMTKVKPRKEHELSFEDWVVARFGWELYKVYFQPYTQKVWGIPTSELSAEWAAARIGIPSLLAAAYRMFFPGKGANRPKTIIDQFYYPRDGFGMVTDQLVKVVEDGTGKVICGAAVTSVDPRVGRVAYEQDGETHEIHGDVIINTLPITLLMRMLPADTGAPEIAQKYQLEYRDIIVVDLALNRERVSTDSWTYFPAPELIFGRTHEPKNWSASMIPSPDVTSLCTEIFTSRGEGVWEMSDNQIVQTVIQQMHDINLLHKDELIKGWVYRVPFAYPVYRVGYEKKLGAVKDFMARFPNLYLVGRTGSFHYMNSDGVIEDVFRLMTDLFPDGAVRVRALEEATGQVTGRWI